MTARRCETRLGLSLIIFVIYGRYISVFAVTSIHPLSLNVFAGENAVFECNIVEASTNHVWQWFKGDENPELIAFENDFTKNGYEFVVSNTRQASSLTILNTTIENDQSRYYCQFGSVSNTATLTVIVGSRLDPIYPECEADVAAVNTRKTVTMRCGASGGNPRPSLQWYRNGVTMEHDDFTHMGDDNSYFNESTRVLNIEDEEAVFMCKAEGLAATENQICYIDIRVPPTVMITSTTTSFSTGDLLEFTCLAMTPWNVTDYIWTVNNQLVSTSNFIYNLTDDKTTLIMNNLQSADADTEIKCEAVTASGLTGSNTVTISFIDESNIFKIIAIVIGGVIFLTLICLILFILIRRRKLQEKASFDKPVVLVEPSYRKYSADVIVHGVDNPTFVNVINRDYYSNGSHLTPPVRVKLNDHNYDTKIDVHGVAENYPKMETPSGFETYANAGSIASLGSFCSFNSFDDDPIEEQNQRTFNNTGSQDSIDFDQLYAKPFKGKQSQDSSSIDGIADFGDLYAKPVNGKHKPDTQSIDGIHNFGDLYAKPIKEKQNPDTRLNYGIADFGDLYAKPIKHRQSIHQSLENILESPKKDTTSSNRSESVDDLYSKPNKKRVTASPEHLPQLYAKPDRTHKQASEARPITYPGGPKIENNTLSNYIEQDFTYSSIV